MCGEVVFAFNPTTKDAGRVGVYGQDRHAIWAHSGPDLCGQRCLYRLDRISQSIRRRRKHALFLPERTGAGCVVSMSVIKIGQGKYSEIFARAPAHDGQARRPYSWPPMLTRLDSNGVRRSKNVAIRSRV